MALKIAAVVVLLACICQINGASNSLHQDISDFKDLMKLLSKPRVLDRHRFKNEVLSEPGMVKGISWNNCGASSDPLQVKSLSLSPDPVKIPGNISLSVAVSSKVDLTQPLQVQLTVKKKVLFWIEIPCVDNVGSCTYTDICTMLTKVQCPPELIKAGINCRCPLKAGDYNLPKSSITIPPVNIPSWLEDGDYQVTARLSVKGQSVGCIFIQLSLAHGNSLKRKGFY